MTAPDLAIFTEDGWVVENVGVAPDIEVEQDPAAVAAGKDPQLDRAIEVVLAELAKSPPAQPPARPPVPDSRPASSRMLTPRPPPGQDEARTGGTTSPAGARREN